MKTTITENKLIAKILHLREDRWGRNLCVHLGEWISERDEHCREENGEMIINVKDIVSGFTYFKDLWEWAAAHFVTLERAQKALKLKANTWRALDEETVDDYISAYYEEISEDVWIVDSITRHDPFLVGEFRCEYIK